MREDNETEEGDKEWFPEVENGIHDNTEWFPNTETFESNTRYRILAVSLRVILIILITIGAITLYNEFGYLLQ